MHFNMLLWCCKLHVDVFKLSIFNSWSSSALRQMYNCWRPKHQLLDLIATNRADYQPRITVKIEKVLSMWREYSELDVLTLILFCWIPAFWTASCLWRRSFSSSWLAQSSLSAPGCVRGGGLKESSRRLLQLEPSPGLTWGLQRVAGWVVGLCALLGQGEEVLFGGAGLRVQDLVDL